MNLASEMNADSMDPMWTVYSPVNKGYTTTKLSRKIAIEEIRDIILDLIGSISENYPVYTCKAFL